MERMKYQLELACFDLESAFIAGEAGADRIELCAELKEGGTTPSWQMVQEARAGIKADIYLMIRPRGGNFVYSDDEFEDMKNDIVAFKRLGVNGFVFGILTDNNEIDVSRNKDLVHFAYPLPCTFHRAFDRTPDIFQSLETVIECGFQTILTSGAAANVVDGLAALKQLVTKAADRIVIMPGGGLRAANIDVIKEASKAIFYHSSAITDGSLLADREEIMALKQSLLRK